MYSLKESSFPQRPSPPLTVRDNDHTHSDHVNRPPNLVFGQFLNQSASLTTSHTRDGSDDTDTSIEPSTPSSDGSTPGFPLTPRDEPYFTEPYIVDQVISFDVQQEDFELYHQRGLVQCFPKKIDDAVTYRKLHHHERALRVNTALTLNALHPPSEKVAPQQFRYNDTGVSVPGRRKALCIGINYKGQPGRHLRGCVNDAHRMRDFLVKHAGYKLDDIETLTDDGKDILPTRMNMIKAMRRLVHGAEPNDRLFLHYAGHGIQVDDQNGDESDHKDEAIVPLDFNKKGYIVDDDLHILLVKSLPEGCRLTALIDACHSGTALDLPYNYLCMGEKDSLSLCTQKPSALNGSVVSWSGCKDAEESEEVSSENTYSGIMTDAFIRSLEKNSSQSYQGLYDEIWECVGLKHRQKPQLGVSHIIDAGHTFVF